jgi:hypothetical protein
MKKTFSFWMCAFLVVGFFIFNSFSCTKLSDTLSPARGVSGTWEGTLVTSDNNVHNNFLMNGDLKLVLTQDGNNVTGTMTVTSRSYSNIPEGWETPQAGVTYSGQLSGTISGVNIDFTVIIGNGCMDVHGTFTSSNMEGMKNATAPPMLSCGETVNSGHGAKGIEWHVYKK